MGERTLRMRVAELERFAMLMRELVARNHSTLNIPPSLRQDLDALSFGPTPTPEAPNG